MTVGLTLGKFAPLHQGHQLLIEAALAETDQVIVVIYDASETTDVPLSVRSAWIRSLYPEVRVIEAWDGPSAVGYTDEVMRAHERYLIEVLGLRNVTHFWFFVSLGGAAWPWTVAEVVVALPYGRAGPSVTRVVGGRPARGRSLRPARRSAWKRLRHLVTI